jgi:Tol biopolymer transport system component
LRAVRALSKTQSARVDGFVIFRTIQRGAGPSASTLEPGGDPMKTAVRIAAKPCATALAIAMTASVTLAQGVVQRINVNALGEQAQGSSGGATITPDGRFVAFDSYAGNLVPNDATPTTSDVFLVDRESGTIELLDLSSAGVQADDRTRGPVALSSDGVRAAFVSLAGNLVAGDTNNVDDVFVRDGASSTCVRVSVASDGSQSDRGSSGPLLSADGQLVVFVSQATNLVAGDTNGFDDIFTHDLASGVTQRVSVGPLGQANDNCSRPALSGDGRFVAFNTTSPLVVGSFSTQSQIYLYECMSGELRVISHMFNGDPANGSSVEPSLSYDGQRIAFRSWASNLIPGDVGGGCRVYMRDLNENSYVLVTQNTLGQPANNSTLSPPVISPDGSVVLFTSYATNLAPDASTSPSTYTNLYLRDLRTQSTQCIGLNVRDKAVGGYFHSLGLSNGGRQVVFTTASRNVVGEDTNHKDDVFLRDRGDGAPESYCHASVTTLGCEPELSWNGAPSVTGSAPFTIDLNGAPGQSSGLLFYGFAPAHTRFRDALLCVQDPITRTSVQPSGGAPGTCLGAFSYDFQALIRGRTDPALAGRHEVYAQYWFRDPVGGVRGVSQAVHFVIRP